MVKSKAVVTNEFYEKWIPIVIIGSILLIIFPYSKIQDFFNPEPETIIEYVYVPEYIYIEKEKEKEPEIQEPPPPPPKPKEHIICVFDIDNNTITSGVPGECIKMCKQMGCKLAINTSRDTESTLNLPLEELGLVSPHFDKSDYHYNPQSKTSSFEDAAATKVSHMETLQTKYGISNPNRLIILDDNIININAIKEKGFGTLQIGMKEPGIQQEDIEKLHKMIVNLIREDSNCC